MQVAELKQNITKGEKNSLYIFTGEEVAVLDIYVKQIIKKFNIDAVRANSVAEIYNKVQNRSILGKPTCYIISNDQEFIKAEKIWDQLNSSKAIGDNIIILTYPNLDKRSKFFKHFSTNLGKESGTIVEFEKMSPELLLKKVKKEVTLDDFFAQNLINLCEANYNRILLECDKIRQLAKAANLSHCEAFELALAQGLIYQPIGDIVFTLIDKICLNDIKDSFYLWNKLKEFESPVKIISLLYNSFKSILQVQLAGKPKGMSVSEFTGLTPWQVKLANEKKGVFTIDRLIEIVKLIRSTEKGIKTGLIEQEISVDYLLVNILGV